jgi:hypothetical protein
MTYTRHIPDIYQTYENRCHMTGISGIYQIYTIHNNMTGIYLSYTHIITFLQVPDGWPGRARVLALGCCARPHGRVVAGNILLEVTAISGRADPWWVLAGGRQVPSESVARRSRHVRRFEWRVGPLCRADCGRWWPAKLCVQPGRSKSVSAPRGPLRAAMSGVVCRAIARAGGFSRRPGAGPRPSPRQRRASGAGVRERTWGPWFGRLPAASTRATEDPVQPAVGGLSTADCSRWVSESAFLCRKPLKDSSSWKRGLPQRLVPRWRRRSRGASLRLSQFSGPCLSSRKFQSHGGVQAPHRG